LRLSELCETLRGAGVRTLGFREVEVTSISTDSRRVSPGALFCALKGAHADGADFAADAARRGAVAVLTERAEAVTPLLPQLIVPDARAAMRKAAWALWGESAEAVRLAAVTGTNGKTTTATLLRDMLRKGGLGAGLVGTLGRDLGKGPEPTGFTTPETAEVLGAIAEMHHSGIPWGVIEASSQALALGRLDGFEFRVAVFTNLSREHLDFHGTMERYLDAKAILFERLAPDATAVLNADDPASEKLACRTRARVIRTGLAPGPDVAVQVCSPSGRVTVSCPRRVRLSRGDESVEFAWSLAGRHNLLNLAAAAGAALAAGIGLAEIARAAEEFRGVPGRLEQVPNELGIRVLVDFAHTPGALEAVLRSLRMDTERRLVCLFGCGGDRDRTKRPVMGRIATELADVVVLSSDNPRSEDPVKIIDEILAGIADRSKVHAEPDRARAIELALSLAREGDTVLLAGKGHETEQIVGTERIPFNDAAEARKVLERLRHGSGRSEGKGNSPPAAPAERPASGAGWDLAELARACGGRLAGPRPKGRSSGVSTDTRTLRPGEVFFALRGERFDGHDFLAEAARKGAACAVICEDRLELASREASSLPLVVVRDTFAALGTLAAEVRSRSRIPWCAVTGSAGKTTTKELLAAALGALGGPVLKAPASFNNRVGVPLTILGLDVSHRAAALELGTSSPGEIASLAAIARPTVAVITAIGESHIERFGTVEAVAREKSEVLRALVEGGVSVLPADSEWLGLLRAAAPGKVVTFGFSPGAEVRAEALRTDGLRTRFTVGGVEFALRLPGRANVSNALAALAAAEAAGVRREEAAHLMSEVEPLPHRGRLLSCGGLAVYDDCYNANPLSFRAAIESWRQLAEAVPNTRRWVVAGDMRELGPRSRELHEELGRALAFAGASALLAVGEFAADVLRGARDSGLAADRAFAAASAREAAALARRLARDGDLVLVKGSRAVGLEAVVEALVGGSI